MKNLFIVFASALLMGSCNSSVSNSNSLGALDTTHIVGNDADAHGCKGSAGYTWSVIKNECIRPWENTLQLLPINHEDSSAIITASVIFSTDSSQAELFMANETENLVLDKIENGYATMTDLNTFDLTVKDNIWTITKSGKAIYKSK
jgi:hypothetical protein